jgi:succinate dehydrogenase / fumarate reductase flavoprotein subunit
MQGLADGYFVLPYTIGDYLSNEIRTGRISTDSPEFEETEKAVNERIAKLLTINGSHPVDYFHKRLGLVMWNKVGMARNEQGLKEAIEEMNQIKNEFWSDLKVPGTADSFNQELEKAGRVADLIELGILMAKDALERNESCGGHFREESVELEGEQKGEAKRDDENFKFVSAWEWTGDPAESRLHKEALDFEYIELKQRSYK